MSSRLKNGLFQLLGVVLGGGMLYLALRGIDLRSVGETLREANYAWLLPLIVVMLASHVLRAWRWTMLLEALPEATGQRVSVRTAFYAVMIGYMVNYAVPRLGEIVRTTNVSAQEKLPFGGVFGTVVVERLLDVATLGVALLSVVVLLWNRFALLDTLFFTPIVDRLAALPLTALVLAGLGVLVLVWLGYGWMASRKQSHAHRIRRLLFSFRAGLGTLLRAPRRRLIGVSTVLMWGCYLFMAHLPFVIFGMDTAFHLNLLDTWSIMVLGAIGVVIPAPGGAGPFHYITIQTLVHLFAVTAAPAASYAILAHGGQLLLYTVVGFGSLLLQGARLRDLLQHPPAAKPS
jgi:hypothetical protein